MTAINVKLKIARAQLGTALDLFLRDIEPLSVHALACGGATIIEGIAKEAGVSPMYEHILQHHPETDKKKLVTLRNQYWNALKHFYKGNSNTARDDEELMRSFSDKANDAILFLGWSDYLKVTGKLPVAAQVLQVWWYATNERAINPATDPTPYRSVFPGINEVPRAEQKRRLREIVEKHLGDKSLLDAPATENEPL